MAAVQSDYTANTIDVRVKWRKELGYKGVSGYLANLGRATCLAFTLSLAASQTATRQRFALRISTDARLEEVGEYYVCNYVIPDMPLDRAIIVSLGVSALDLSMPWIGGSEAEPPPEQQRTVLVPTRTAILSKSQPGVRLSYEMVYAPIVSR